MQASCNMRWVAMGCCTISGCMTFTAARRGRMTWAASYTMPIPPRAILRPRR